MAEANPEIIRMLENVAVLIIPILGGDIQVDYYSDKDQMSSMALPAHYRIFRKVPTKGFWNFSEVKLSNILLMPDPCLGGNAAEGSIEIRVINEPRIVFLAERAARQIINALPELQIEFTVKAYGAGSF